MLAKYATSIRRQEWMERGGTVRDCVGSVISALGPDVALGERCLIARGDRRSPVEAEVVGFRDEQVLLMPYAELAGIRPGDTITATGRFAEVCVGRGLLGRVVDAYGMPIDGKPASGIEGRRSLYGAPINPLARRRIRDVFATGVKAVDLFLTLGVGQRIGLFAGSGVGKSALLGMIARNSAADVNVIALVGERGREVRDFIEDHLGEGLARSVVVVASAEQSPLVRSQAAFAATSIAEYFRDQGLSVALLVDSITRFAMARREIGLAVGEPPTARGYTPSVFSLLPRLLERAGSFSTSDRGAVTGIYTVLVEGDDLNEPISDAVRAILDGHIVLSRDIANRGRYPAIDLLGSVSRLFAALTDQEQKAAVRQTMRLLAAYADSKDAIDLGAYKSGSNAELDRAIEVIPRLEQFLGQQPGETVAIAQARQEFLQLIGDGR
jgi:flagellum-specific ATP synthase